MTVVELVACCVPEDLISPTLVVGYMVAFMVFYE
jgi:hypothetical protein